MAHKKNVSGWSYKTKVQDYKEVNILHLHI